VFRGPVLKRVVLITGLLVMGSFILFAAVTATGDEVTLKAGDTLRGRIIGATDSSITIVHDVLGEIRVPKEHIASMTLTHDVLGEITIGADGIASFGLDKGEGEPAAPVETDTLQEEDEETALFEPEFQKLNAWAARLKKKGWSAILDLSINTSSGNTDEQATRLGAHVKRTLRDERMDVDMSYYHKRSDGVTTDNKFTVGLTHDWLQTGSRWFFFTAGRFDFDEFKSWEQRANVQGGPGYNVVQSEKVLLDLRFGVGGRKEWGSLNSSLKLEGLAGFDFAWKISERQSFDTAVQLYPVLTDWEDYRTRSTLNWRYLLSRDVNLSLLFGIVNEYQSVVNAGDEEMDMRVFTGIQMSFD
jgi:putative salt-induced outer membrane protein YdiY